MSHNLLFRHHAGRMPGPARWYLAVMVMLSLMLMAAHFTVQAYAQKVMQRTVNAWLAPMAGQAAQVRYRLLRGALTIDDMRIGQGQRTIHVSHIYLHASTNAMLSKAVRMTRVRLDGMNLSLPRADLIRWLQSTSSNVMTEWLSVMNHVDKLILVNGRVRFTDEKNPWQVRNISGHMAVDGFDLNGNSSGGLIRLHGERDHHSFNSITSWKHMATARMAHIMGLKVNSHGSNSGLLNWHVDWPHRRFGFDGDVQLVDQPGHGDMHIQGETGPNGTKVQVRCSSISLAGLGEILPVVNGRIAQAGMWSGNVRIGRQEKKEPWVATMSGEVHGLNLASGDLPAWTIERMTLNNAVAQWPAHQLNVEQVQIYNMDMALRSQLQSPGPARSPASPWHFQVVNLTFENVRPAIGIHGRAHRLILPSLKGSGHMEANGYTELDAVSEGEVLWHIAGKGHLDGLFNADIKAENVPVVQLRPLLPDFSLPGSSGALQLSGNSQFQVSLQTSHDKLILKGQLTLADLMLSQGGDSFLAGAIHIDIQQTGMLEIQRLTSIRIDQWRYQVALRPIPRTTELEAARETENQHKKFSWQVDEIAAENGIISVGSEDAVWADHASFSLKNLRAGTWSPLVFNASVGGGNLHMRGRIDLFSADTRIKLNARLRDTLPFFLNNWLTVSGSPSLIRGRLDGSFHIKPARGKSTYTGGLNLVLHQGQFEHGTFPQDPMLPLTGYNIQALSERFGRRGLLKIDIPFKGDWRAQPFSIEHLGFAALQAIKRQASSAKKIQGNAQPASKTVSHVRLQHGRAFSHNEHVRLWQVVKALRKQPRLIVELLPQLGNTPLDKSLISRTRHTQAMIEHYMHKRGIARRRIYPVWPVAEHRHGDITGIKIIARMP
ncbi:MAG: hypothetical protein Q9M24_05155 [Mariprofundaceae bacterium]|nr:hypothetical protein [Mariprofundaceae bacterium]